jgi:hypothetical protein
MFQIKFTKEAGILSYYEICDKLKSENYTRVWNTEQIVPYLHNSEEWIGYEDKESLIAKVNILIYLERKKKKQIKKNKKGKICTRNGIGRNNVLGNRHC